jgi:uncharacterized protein YkuJ
MPTLEEVRLRVEGQVKLFVEHADVVNWCNNAQSEFMININLPATGTIAVNANDLTYPLPANLKIINRLSLVSDEGEYRKPWRIYNGNIIFTVNFSKPDTMNIDYYKHYTYYKDTTDVLDLPELHIPLYSEFCLSQWYCLPEQMKRLGEGPARQEYEKHMAQYQMLKQQVISYYSLSNEPTVINERW